MAFEITYKIPGKAYDQLTSQIVYDQIKKEFTTQQLIILCIKTIKKNQLKFEFTNNLYTLTDLGEYFHLEKLIKINTEALVFCEMPNVIIHEILHAVFHQLEEHHILKLEKQIASELTIKNINTVLHEVFNGRWKYTGPADRFREHSADTRLGRAFRRGERKRTKKSS